MHSAATKIDHVNIVVRDLNAAKNFFADLGFALKREGDLQGEWLDTLTGLDDVQARYVGMALPDDSLVLELLEFKSPQGGRDEAMSELNQIGFRHIAMQVQNIEKVVAELKQKGLTFLSDIQDYEPLKKKLCYFIGPEGIILELAEYKRN